MTMHGHLNVGFTITPFIPFAVLGCQKWYQHTGTALERKHAEWHITSPRCIVQAQFQNHWCKRICLLTDCGSAIMRLKFRSLISCTKIKILWKARRHDNQTLLSTYLFCASLFELILSHEFWLKETWQRSQWYRLTSVYWCCQSVLQASVGFQDRILCP